MRDEDTGFQIPERAAHPVYAVTGHGKSRRHVVTAAFPGGRGPRISA